MRTQEITNSGAGRGAKENTRHFAEYAAQSQRIKPHINFIDPQTEKLNEIVEHAKELNISATSYEGRGEAVIMEQNLANTPIISTADDPSANVSLFQNNQLNKSNLFAYCVIRTESNDIYGMAFCIGVNDLKSREDASAFFQSVNKLIVPGGSSNIYGARGLSHHKMGENMLRRRFGKHAHDNIIKGIYGLNFVNSPMEASINGQELSPVILVNNSLSGWATPDQLGEQTLENWNVPMGRGSRFTVAELGPEGIRFHHVFIRHLNGEVAIKGYSSVGDASSNSLSRLSTMRQKQLEAVKKAIQTVPRQPRIQNRPYLYMTD